MVDGNGKPSPQGCAPWTTRDKLRHLIPAIPLILFYIGVIYFLAVKSWWVVGGFLLLWVGTNLSVAGICAECPYRGGYCPGLSQLYFAPFLSSLIFKGKAGRTQQPSTRTSLTILGIFGIGSYIYAFYWLIVWYWGGKKALILVLLGLVILHMPLSFFILCPRCGYNETCPMAKVSKIIEKGDNP